MEEEEKLIINHRQHIDDAVNTVKDEMSLLNNVDKPGSDVEAYALDLDKILLDKMNMIQKMRD